MSNRMSEVVEEQELPQEAIGWAARDSSGILSPFKFQRRATGAEDVTLKVLYCGVCHSDLALMKNDWGLSVYPLVPGHEIVGIVVEVGFKVEKFKVGDKVGIGLLVSSCQICEDCSNSLECYCPKFVASCYGKCNDDGTTVTSYGGFSDIMVANMRYVVHIPDNLPLDGSAPLLCAGITVYSPMKYYGLTDPGMHVGVVGLGGLGHLAVKFAKAFGVKVTVISTSLGKKEEAIQRLGADSFLLSSDSEQLKAAIGTMDSIIDTVSSVHSLYPLIALLKNHGKLILVGLPDQPLELPAPYLAMGNKAVLGSFIGGMKSMQEMLDFAGKHNITADVEVVPMNYVNTAMERLSKSDVRYRFVLDIANTIKVKD